MSGIGFSELIILFLIGLIVLGPERLPRVANQLGNWIGQARRMTRVMKRQLEDELDLEKTPDITPPTVRVSTTYPGANAQVVATGGLAGRVANESAVIDRVEPFLTLEGLRIIFEKNRPTRRAESKQSPKASRPKGGAQQGAAERSRENPDPSKKEK